MSRQEAFIEAGIAYRYWLGQNAVANGFTTFSVYWPSKHDVLANCRYFLDIKDY